MARLYNTMKQTTKNIKQLSDRVPKEVKVVDNDGFKDSLPKETNLILEPTKYPRTDPDIVFGKTKPTISKKDLGNTLMITTLYWNIGSKYKQVKH